MVTYFGNLTITDIERKAGVEFPPELIEFMKDKHHAPAAKIPIGKWHCFDDPFVLVFGDRETATEAYKYLAPLSNQFKQKLKVCLEHGA